MRKFFLFFIILTFAFCKIKEDENNNFNLEQLQFLEDKHFDHDHFLEEDISKIINDFQDEENIDPLHGAGFLFVAGIIKGVEIFNNVTHTINLFFKS